MIKLFAFLLLLTLTAIASMWFVENDGSVTLVWLGYRIQTSVAFTIIASMVLVIFLTALLQLISWMRLTPKRYAQAAREKKRERGFKALTDGFVAIAAGDTKEARKLTKKAESNLGRLPIVTLLSAQTAQSEGDRDLANKHYNTMLEDKQTEIIAIKGLLVQAREEGNLEKAIFLAEKANALKPDATWPVSILLDLYKRTGHWQDAEKMVNRAYKLKLLTNEEMNRSLAVITLARAYNLYNDGQSSKANSFAYQAYKQLPEFSPAVYLYALLLHEKEDYKKALKILETGWKKAPHPLIIEHYREWLKSAKEAKPLDQLEKLVKQHDESSYGHIAYAKAALDAELYSKARNHLKVALNIVETKEICQLMAQLERQEGTGRDIVENWENREQGAAPPAAWTCNSCGFMSTSWHANCGNCGNFDSYQWLDQPGNTQAAPSTPPINAAILTN